MNFTEMQEWFELSGRTVDPIVGALLMNGAEMIERAYVDLSDDRLGEALEAMMQATFENYPPTVGELYEGGERVADIFVGWLVWNAVNNGRSVMDEATEQGVVALLADTPLWATARANDTDVWDMPAFAPDNTGMLNMPAFDFNAAN